ncbi:MAG: hypothetical protein ILP07_00670 [Treponema sp.]|nr:hypothetical protein [Treponema sp.]
MSYDSSEVYFSRSSGGIFKVSMTWGSDMLSFCIMRRMSSVDFLSKYSGRIPFLTAS